MKPYIRNKYSFHLIGRVVLRQHTRLIIGRDPGSTPRLADYFWFSIKFSYYLFIYFIISLLFLSFLLCLFYFYIIFHIILLYIYFVIGIQYRAQFDLLFIPAPWVGGIDTGLEFWYFRFESRMCSIYNFL